MADEVVAHAFSHGQEYHFGRGESIYCDRAQTWEPKNWARPVQPAPVLATEFEKHGSKRPVVNRVEWSVPQARRLLRLGQGVRFTHTSSALLGWLLAARVFTAPIIHPFVICASPKVALSSRDFSITV